MPFDSPPGDAARHPLVSVIIPHLNQHEQAMRCLDSLAAQSWPADATEVILVDNGSNKPLSEVAAAYPEVRILREESPGPGLARNRGVAAARGEILAFIDADCRADPGWIAAAVDALRAPGATGVAGGDVRIDFLDPPRLSELEAYEAVFAYRQKLYIRKHGFSGTGNLAMHAPVHAAVGPFAGIGLAEDVDWGNRAKAKGFAARYSPDMIVFHPARRTLAELQTKWRRHITHQLNHHRAANRPEWLWQARALAVLLSAFAHIPLVLTSDRLDGLAVRMKALAMLFRIRWFRWGEMRQQARRTGGAADPEWNRSA
jgi:glycosyltransferase involved in cell wall biosynthesis